MSSGHDLDDGVGRAPPVLGLRGHEGAHRRGSRDMRPCEAPQGEGGTRQLGHAVGAQVLLGDPAVQLAGEVLRVVGLVLGCEQTHPRVDGGQLTRVTPLLEQGHGAIVAMTPEVGAASQTGCYKGVTKSDLPLCSLPSPGCSHPAGVSRSA